MVKKKTLLSKKNIQPQDDTPGGVVCRLCRYVGSRFKKETGETKVAERATISYHVVGTQFGPSSLRTSIQRKRTTTHLTRRFRPHQSHR